MVGIVLNVQGHGNLGARVHDSQGPGRSVHGPLIQAVPKGQSVHGRPTPPTRRGTTTTSSTTTPAAAPHNAGYGRLEFLFKGRVKLVPVGMEERGKRLRADLSSFQHLVTFFQIDKLIHCIYFLCGTHSTIKEKH